jgi:uncharacterized protein involved in exopolysaccharide biosynthesis
MAFAPKEPRNYVREADRPVIRRGVVDTHELWQSIRGEPVLVTSIVVAFLAAAILYLHVAAQKYAVRMVVTAVDAQANSKGTLEDLSSMAGLDLGGAGANPKFKMFVGALRSPFAAESLASDPQLLRAMFPRDWSATENRWREPRNFATPVLRGLAKFLGWHIEPWSPPGEARVFAYLQDELKVVPDTKSGVVTLELDSRYPAAATAILRALNDAVDGRIRQRDLTRATTDIDYLTQRLGAATVQEYRMALVTNLVQQEKTRMLASAPLPYVSDALGQPLTSARPVSPIPPAVLIAALLLGGMVGAAAARLRHRRR